MVKDEESGDSDTTEMSEADLEVPYINVTCNQFSPSDPHVFWRPGSGSESISQRYGSGPFYHQSLKNDVNVHSKSNKHKNFF